MESVHPPGRMNLLDRRVPHAASPVGGIRLSELTDFLEAAHRQGYSVDDFQVQAEQATPRPLRTPGRTIVVRRGELELPFDARPGNSWCLQAIAALRSGQFGPV